ncbi:MAG TPA: methionyl-tRNA formyltransferase [Candidatus Nanoarchaeia archaeon]|nr:methionyl-tRNA formyltransferase [uncultured archaeon]
MILKITKNTDPVWKKKFSDVQVTPSLQKIVSDMHETLAFTMGVGLAAPQVGYPWRLFIVDFADLKETFINPKIIKKNEKTDLVEEGCLSIPSYRGFIERPTELELEYTNLKGERKQAKLSGFYARIIQHEYDHLNSTFYTDHITKPKYLYHFDPVRIVFFGSDRFSATILKSLIGQSVIGEYQVPLVITKGDKPSGRGDSVLSNPVKSLAQQFNIETLTPEKITDSYEKIASSKPDLLVLASYGKIIPKEILEIPKYYSLNVHPSLLPKHRGASPLQTVLLKGDKTTGVSIMAMNEKVDQGDVFVRGRYSLKPNETYESLSRQLSKIGAELLHYVIHGVVMGQSIIKGKKLGGLKPKPQKHEKATYTKLIKKEDGKIAWKKPPVNLERMIRAYYPWPGVWCEYNGKILKLLPNHMVQLEGKNPVSLSSFKAGHKDFTLTW